MYTKNIIHLDDLHFDNTRFWAYFLSVNYPCAVSEKDACSMCDFVEQVLPFDPEWIDAFTQYYDGVYEESDGYLEHPTALLAKAGRLGNLKIEFHPGDIIFYLNEEEIGCTGPHWELWKIPYQKIESLLNLENGAVLFLLLLPMADLAPADAARPKPVLEKLFSEFGFTQPIRSAMIDCLICGITKPHPPETLYTKS